MQKNNGRTEREVHTNARGVEQREARMRRPQVHRWNDEGLSSHPIVHSGQ